MCYDMGKFVLWLNISQQFFSHIWTEPPLPGYEPELKGFACASKLMIISYNCEWVVRTLLIGEWQMFIGLADLKSKATKMHDLFSF